MPGRVVMAEVAGWVGWINPLTAESLIMEIDEREAAEHVASPLVPGNS